ncbi:hypothetical protein [Nostoc sp. NOS(2021)]|nr:hypothetical protein [Nostoc sp. NOS(2021)]
MNAIERHPEGLSLDIAYVGRFARSHSQFLLSEFYKLLSPALV